MSWPEALRAFDELVELEPEARERALGSLDPELRGIVQRLLGADGRADLVLSPLETALAGGVEDPLGLVGRTISHFRVTDVLACGGMGVVYRAEDLRLGRAAALKFPLAASRLDPRARERFLHEARIVAALDHPRLCGIYETVEGDDGRRFHAMPLYEGETLKARLARERFLSLPVVLDLAAQIADGLGAAHRAGIVHRDLKPANLMLLPDGTLKILDFGLAKVSDVTLTGSWLKLGTAAYMAPEQVLGCDLDRRTDLWALGVVLFEMATGERPFAGGHEIAVAHAILHEDPPAPSSRRAGLPPAFDALVGRLLEKDPARRPADAGEVAEAMAAIRTEGPAGRRRLSPKATVAACAAAALVGWGGWSAHQAATRPALPVSVAVLPFTAPEDEQASRLAFGLADAVRTELARLGGVIAPGHAAMARYAGSGKTPASIAAEQGAGALLVGDVRPVGAALRVSTRLLDAAGTREMWSREFERSDGAWAPVSTEIVRSTATALRVGLTPAEKARLESPPTLRADAWAAYVRGRAIELEATTGLFVHPTADDIRRSQSFFARARDLDPAFALARARLALSHTLSALAYDTTAARREHARLEAEAALRLQPGMAEGHEALAAYWELSGDPGKALEESRRAVAALPNSAAARLALASRYARAGRLDDAAAAAEEAMRLEPGNPVAAFMAAVHLLRLRRDEAAMRAFDRVIAVAPEYHMAKVIRGHTWLRWKGVPDTLAVSMRSIPEEWDPDGMATWARFTALWSQRQYGEALAMLDRSRAGLSRDGLVYQPMPLMRARLYDTMGDRARAREEYLAARSVLLDSLETRPNDASIRIALGLTYAGLGRRDDAVREARNAMELVPVAGNTPAATAFMGGAVEVFARAGDIDGAIELLELLFSMPAGREVTVAYLKVWPAFDPLRADPRFGELLERFGGSLRGA